MLDLKFSNQSARFLEKCDTELYRRIMKKIRELLINPYPKDSTKLEGRRTQRVKVGKYRIIYAIIKENNELFVADIDKRERVYE